MAAAHSRPLATAAAPALLLALWRLLRRGAARRSTVALLVAAAGALWAARDLRRSAAAVPAPSAVPSLAQRGLRWDLPTLPNFRSVGGLRGAGGRAVRHGVLYRSGTLGGLSGADAARLGELDLRLVADFRSATEVRRQPDRLPPGWRGERRHFDVSDGNPVMAFRNILYAGRGTDKQAACRELLAGMMRACAVRHHRTYAAFLRALAAGQTPALVHCTAGKDRTGWAVAVLLATLGVDEDDIVRDYLVSNALWYPTARKYAVLARVLSLFRATTADTLPCLQVREEYLRGAFAEVRRQWGSIDRYIAAQDGLGLGAPTVAALRDRFLDVPPSYRLT